MSSRGWVLRASTDSTRVTIPAATSTRERRGCAEDRWWTLWRDRIRKGSRAVRRGCVTGSSPDTDLQNIGVRVIAFAQTSFLHRAFCSMRGYIKGTQHVIRVDQHRSLLRIERFPSSPGPTLHLLSDKRCRPTPVSWTDDTPGGIMWHTRHATLSRHHQKWQHAIEWHSPAA